MNREKYPSTTLETKNSTWVLLFQIYEKIWSVMLGHFIKPKPLISEEWTIMATCQQRGLEGYDKMRNCVSAQKC